MEAINVLARLVLTVVLVVVNNWFIFYFCTVVMTPFLNRPIFSDRLVQADSVEAIQPCHDMRQFNCDDYNVSNSCIVRSNQWQERSTLFWYEATVLSPVLTAFLIGCFLVTLH